ncbi:hypothetical protein [Nocardioides sp. URHA0020]|uniref:hypothetical protein n=1 Tax=Nocardioides sp. URHA0020 TaxID=1380392 RepID=UPI0012DFADB7|nr:hypothetical protein [Nocardioides sp. URHA0020]
MSQDRPASVKAAVWLTLALVALSGVMALLSIIFRDDLMEAWESGRPDASSLKPPAIAPVAAVMLVVVALLALVILEFFRSQHGWARWALTGNVVLMALGTCATLRIGPPALFVVLSVVGLVLQVAIVVALWHRDTSAYLRESRRAGDLPAAS